MSVWRDSFVPATALVRWETFIRRTLSGHPARFSLPFRQTVLLSAVATRYPRQERPSSLTIRRWGGHIERQFLLTLRLGSFVRNRRYLNMNLPFSALYCRSTESLPWISIEYPGTDVKAWFLDPKQTGYLKSYLRLDVIVCYVMLQILGSTKG